VGKSRAQCQTSAVEDYDVEFVDAGQPSVDEPATPAPAPRQPPTAARLTAVLWGAAGALCVASPFQTVYSYKFSGASIQSAGGFDGWGRPVGSTLAAELLGEHGTRYGIALCVCAALLGLVAFLVPRGEQSAGGWGARLDNWLQRHATVIGISAVAMLLGVLGSMALGVESAYSTYHALDRALQDPGRGVFLSIGPCLWLGLAAALFACAALIVQGGGRLPRASHSDLSKTRRRFALTRRQADQ